MDVYNAKEMWGALAFRGVIAILFGIAAVFWPGLTLATLVYLFGAYVIGTGLVNLVVGLTNFSGAGRSFWGRILLMLLGIAELGLGVYLIRHPGITFASFILLIGLTLVIRGLFEIVAGLFGDNKGGHRVIWVISGILSALVGILLLKQPVSGGVAFVWLLGLYALITGPMLLALAYEAKHSLVLPPVKARTAR